MVNQKTKEIICVEVRKGRVHDFRIWKESQIDIKAETELLADKGYQGLKKIHAHSRTPIKKTRKKSLSKEQKKFNKQLSKGKDSGLKSLSAIDSRYAFGAILLNILQIIFSITEPQTL